ncbi:MAG: MarR family transcriptional regulator [Rhodospirillaceae bacterium]|nr:MarR family transcriptional regulator [Rhodospirillaceae bacterium]|tara:strand:- start:25658 stop:26104 length:447 start_codon:yes stop_codon:yes gene_type:complete
MPLDTVKSADDILSAIHVLANMIGGAYGDHLDDAGITVPEWRVVLTLARYPRSTATEITDRWAMDKMAISRAIQRLEKSGTIQRKRNPDDRRSYRLSLTANGQDLYERILPVANERYQALVSTLTRRELGALHKSLDKLIAHVEKMNG